MEIIMELNINIRTVTKNISNTEYKRRLVVYAYDTHVDLELYSDPIFDYIL